MKIGSTFINTSRGEAVCEESLVKALIKKELKRLL